MIRLFFNDPFTFVNSFSELALDTVAKRCSRAFYDRTHHIEIFVLGLLAQPKGVALGISAGSLDFMLKYNLTKLVIKPAVKTGNILEISQAATKPYILEDYVNFRGIATIGPIIEEITFRVIIQRSVAWSVDRIFQLNYKYFGEITLWKIKIGKEGVHFHGYILTAKKIAICVSTVLFITAHTNKTTPDKLIMIPGSLMMGYLADKEGVISSIFAHITLNSLATFPAVLLIKIEKNTPGS